MRNAKEFVRKLIELGKQTHLFPQMIFEAQKHSVHSFPLSVIYSHCSTLISHALQKLFSILILLPAGEGYVAKLSGSQSNSAGGSLAGLGSQQRQRQF